MKKQLLLLLFFLGLTLLYYWKSLFSYFQGDEWYYFTQILPQTKETFGPLKIIYHSIADANQVSGGAHVTPISNLLFFLSANFFTFTYWPYALCAIVIHAINSYLTYRFVLKLSKEKRIAVITSLFFAISYVHFQAITWAMTYIWTALSVTFFLLCLLFLLNSLEEKQNKLKHTLLSGLFLFCALLTKESTAIIFIITALLIILKKGFSKSNGIYVNFFGFLFVMYVLYRTALPKVLNHFHPQPFVSEPTHALDPLLSLFRVFTYPLKMLVELFIPQQWILSTTEALTPLAYPTYGAEQSVRGTNFLTFTQSAGSDILIYILAVIILFFVGIGLKNTWKNNRRTFNILVTAFVLIIGSSLPLILVATYAPWWGYVTFIDSRHLYIASIGAGILFAYTIVWLAESFRNKVGSKALISVFFIIWAIVQFALLQTQLDKEVSFGEQRKTVINKIIQTVHPKKKTVVLVQSDTGYYGFGPIPPFQTNLGQVLTVIYYQKDQLPESFIKSDYLAKGSLGGEGYAEFEGKGFGYYVDQNNLIEAMRDEKIDKSDIYAFSWKGKQNEIEEISDSVREKLQQKRNEIALYKDWKKVFIKEGNLTLLVPPDATIEDIKDSDVTNEKSIAITSSQAILDVTVRKRTLNIGIFEDIAYLKDSDGQLVGDNNYLLDIPMKRGDTITAKVTTTGQSMKYFLPTLLPDKIIEITSILEQPELHKSSFFTEELVSLMSVKK
jgi:hypothetical protein